MRSQHSSKPFKHQRTVISEKLKDASSAVSDTKNSQQAEAQPDSLKEKKDREERGSYSDALWNFICIQQQEVNYEYNWAGRRPAFRAGLTSYNSDLICRNPGRVGKAVWVLWGLWDCIFSYYFPLLQLYFQFCNQELNLLHNTDKLRQDFTCLLFWASTAGGTIFVWKQLTPYTGKFPGCWTPE